MVQVIGARANNLKSIDVSIPLGTFVCVTGVSGSGKSTFVVETLYRALARRLHNSRDHPGEHDGIKGLEFLDKVIDHARSTADELAERIVTLGVAARGQAGAVADIDMPPVPDSFVTDTEALQYASNLLDATIGVLRDAQAPLGEIDAVSEDLVISGIQTFEKQLWMLRSHLM